MPRGPLLSDFEAVLFDIDGTLVDSLETIVLGIGDAIETSTGRRPERDEIVRIIGLPLTSQMAMFTRDRPQAQRMAMIAIERMAFHANLERIYGPAVECLQLCHRQGLKTALVTSKSRIELDPFLKRFVGASAVDVAVCSSDVVNPKPDPECALLACKRLGVSPQQGVLIGDSVFDLRCARDAGLATVAVAYGAGDREALLLEEPDILFDTPEDLLSWAKDAFLQTSCPERR
jgi:pyrophosphatase PpaX